jgi:hypothetical protein
LPGTAAFGYGKDGRAGKLYLKRRHAPQPDPAALP